MKNNSEKNFYNCFNNFESLTLNQLFFLFFNTKSIKNNYFLIELKYKKTFITKIEKDTSLIKKNNNLLNEKYKWNFIYTETNSFAFHKLKLFFDNKKQTIKEDIFEIIYINIQKKMLTNYDYSTILLENLFFLRGSQDLKLNFFSVDIYRKITEQYDYYRWFLKLITTINIKNFNFNLLNLNFRELQPEFQNKKKRNTQIRINLFWLLKEDVFLLMKKINLYKFKNFENIKNNKNLYSKLKEKKAKNKNIFFKKFTQFLSLIHKKEEKILKLYANTKILKKTILLQNNKIIQKNKIKRNQNLIDLAHQIYNHICFGCNKDYDLKNRTFIHKKTKKLYLEIHHVISLSNDSELDNIDNLVKLCPVCHKALSKNRAIESVQKKIIKSILKNSVVCNNFVSIYSKNKSIISNIDFIYSKLK